MVPSQNHEVEGSVFALRVRNLLKSKFVRNVAAVATGTAAAQAITMAFSPIITRQYGPEAFGVLGVFTSLLSVVAPVAALTYPIAIVLPKNHGDARNLVRLSIYISVATAALFSITFVFFQQQIVRALQIEILGPFLFLIPLATLFSAWQQIARQWLIRQKQFAATARVSIFQALAINGTKLAVGFFYPTGAALISISAAGILLHTGMLSLTAARAARAAETNVGALVTEPPANIKVLAYRYRDFPLYRAPQVLISAASQGLPVLMLAAFYGPAIAGFYTLCRTVLSLPSQLIGTSVGDVFYPRIAEAAARGDNLRRLIGKATIALGVVGFLPYALIVAFGPTLFSSVFGSEWFIAGEFARWIALWRFFGLINRPAIHALPVLSAQRFHLVYTCAELVIRLGVLALGHYSHESASVSVALFGASGMITSLILILIVMQLSRRYDEQHSI